MSTETGSKAGNNSREGTPDRRQSRVLYDRQRVLEITSLSSTTLWRLIGKGLFPASVAISPGRVAWDSEAVDTWLKSKLEAA